MSVRHGVALLVAVFIPLFLLPFFRSTAEGASTYTINLSTSANRSSPTPLAGKTVSGNIYVFIGPATGVKQVRFYLDNTTMSGTPTHTESAAPWDLVGGTATAATPFNTQTLSSGSHTLTTAVVKTAGGTDVLNATFTVAGPFALNLSTSPTRSNATPLAGKTVAGSIYVFVRPETGVRQVRFYLDNTAMSGVPRTTEGLAPWDFAGGTTIAANPFNTLTISNGSHTITAAVDRTSGGTNVLHSTFTVANTSLGSTPFSWSVKAAGPLARFEAQGGAASGKLYVFGGFVSGACCVTTLRADAYDPSTNSWARIADLPEPSTHSAVVVDGNTIYLVGGFVGNHPGPPTTHVWKYSPGSNTWTAGPELPEPRGAGAAAIVGRELHYFGGLERSPTGPVDWTDHYALDLDGGTAWTTKAAMPNGRNHLTGASVGGKVYAIGGQHLDDEANGNESEVDAYDPGTDEWTRVASLPSALGHVSSLVLRGRIVVVGGGVNGNARSALVTAYDPSTDTWTKLPSLPEARKTPIVGAFGDLLVVTTGNGPAGASTTTWSGTLFNKWDVGASMPVQLAEVAGGIVGNRLFLVGSGNAATLAYDLSTGAWSSAASLAARPFAGDHHAAEVFGGKLYLLGGLGGGADGKVQIYDPESNSWSLGAAMPFNAGSSASAVINGRIYVAGGIVGSATTAQVARYEPATDTWTLLAPMPQGRNHAAAATDGSKLYVFGGRGPGSGDGNTVANGFDTVQIYDPATNTWRSSLDAGSTLAELPQARGGMGKAVYLNGELYVIGGETSTGAGATAQKVYHRVDVYNPSTNTWRLATAMPTARHGIFPLLRAGRIYVAGGGTQAGASSSSVVETLNAG